jgi:DNA-binding GntR family transcriptional regulator
MKLSTYLREDLQQRIQSGKNLPDKMTLESISKSYKVSLTTVRVAIEELVKTGYVIKQPNGRIIINPEVIGLHKEIKNIKPPKVQTDWDKVFILELMHKSLNKEAIYLREDVISTQYSIGRSIIRQSFNRFSGAGLLEHKPHRGWLVQPLNEEDVLAFIEIREILELKALDLAKDKLLKSDLEKMLIATKSSERLSRGHLDNQLHQYIIDKSGNKYIYDYFCQYVPQYYAALFDFATPETEVVAEMVQQHQRIIEYLIQEKWEKASDELSEHIQAQGPVLKNLLLQVNETTNSK